MTSIEDLKAKHAAEIARKEAELEIAERFPICPEYVGISKNGPDRVTYRKVDPAKALVMLKCFTILPTWKASDGSFTKYATTEEINAENAKKIARGHSTSYEIKDGPFALMLDLSPSVAYGTSASLYFFALVDGEIFRVSFDLEGPGHIGTWPELLWSLETIRDHRNRVIDRKWTAPSIVAMADGGTQYASGTGGPGHRVLAWSADTEEGGREHATAMLVAFLAAAGANLDGEGEPGQ